VAIYFFCYVPETGKDLACTPSYFDMQNISGLSFALYFFILFPSIERTEEWRKAVPSYTQSSGGGSAGGSGTLELRTWSSLPRDDSLEPLPYNWEMAYTETGMVYFIE